MLNLFIFVALFYVFMKKLASLLVILLFVFILSSCSSLDSDAKKAAELNKESLEYVRQQNLEEAEKAYKASQEIVNRYKGTEQYLEFHKAYSGYMLGETTNK